MLKDLSILVIEADEELRKMFNELMPKYYDCYPRTVSSSEEAMKILNLPAKERDFFSVVIIGDPPTKLGRYYENWLSLAQRIKEVLPGLPVISFAIDKHDFEREKWADYNLEKPHISQLWQAIREIRQRSEVKPSVEDRNLSCM